MCTETLELKMEWSICCCVDVVAGSVIVVKDYSRLHDMIRNKRESCVRLIYKTISENKEG